LAFVDSYDAVVANTTTTFSVAAGGRGNISGVLAPNGKIYAIPWSANNFLVIDPVANTTTTFSAATGTFKYHGGVLAPNGKIYAIPYSIGNCMVIDTGATINENFPLSRLFNKF
jgi:hypothetical protein